MKACAPSCDADDGTGAVEDLAALGADPLGEPAAGVAVGDEADVVAVGLLRDGQAARGGLGAHEAFDGVVPEREVGVGELLGRQHAEHVGLVLRGIRCPVQLAGPSAPSTSAA